MSNDGDRTTRAITQGTEGCNRRTASPVRTALGIGLASMLTACSSSGTSRPSSVDGRDSPVTIASGEVASGGVALDETAPKPPRSDFLDRRGPSASRSFSTWLQVDIAGGRTWLNLDRVESILRPSPLAPSGQLPILVVHFGSGRRVELAFDEEADREAALRQIRASLNIRAAGP